jgi:hypothetical protein
MPAKKKAAKLDPKALFVIQTIARADIAENLNKSLESLELTDEELDKLYFAKDDPRLTDKVCRQIANELYEACQDTDEVDEIVFTQYVTNFVK